VLNRDGIPCSITIIRYIENHSDRSGLDFAEESREIRLELSSLFQNALQLFITSMYVIDNCTMVIPTINNIYYIFFLVIQLTIIANSSSG